MQHGNIWYKHAKFASQLCDLQGVRTWIPWLNFLRSFLVLKLEAITSATYNYVRIQLWPFGINETKSLSPTRHEN